VAPIPKPCKDHSNPSNYRPISQLTSISKVFEKIILKRLQDFISANNILPDHQIGFRMAHSTSSHQLRRVVRHVKGRRQPPLSESTGMLLLDAEKAFDSVWHEAHLHKLLATGCNISLARLIFSFQKERSFQVRVGKVHSSSCNIPYSVPQGACAILSPGIYLRRNLGLSR
jgi:hypothetical protein